MIARIWHGRTPLAKADAYARFLDTRAMPDYRSVPATAARRYCAATRAR